MEVEKAGSVDDIDFAAIPFSVDKAAVQAVLPCYFVRCVVRECGAFFNVSCPGDEPHGEGERLGKDCFSASGVAGDDDVPYLSGLCWLHGVLLVREWCVVAFLLR